MKKAETVIHPFNKEVKGRALHEFLLKYYFSEPHRYEAKIIDAFVLVSQWNGDNNQWQVQVWRKETWDKVQTLRMNFLDEDSDAGAKATTT